MTTCKSLSLCGVLFFGVAIGVFANSIITDPGPGFVGFSGNSNTYGYDFTVGSSAIELTALGMWDENQDGFTNPHSIGLWDTAGNLLAKAFVGPGTVDPLVGEFRYATIIPIVLGPVILSAGTTYVLGASYLGSDADQLIVNVSPDQATFDPAVTAGNARFVAGGGFAFPNDTSVGPGSYVGPNAEFTLLSNGVPDSGSTALLLGLAATCLICGHWRFADRARFAGTNR